MSRRKRTSAASQSNSVKRSWRDHSDSLIRSFPVLPSPESLRPGPHTVEAAVSGDPEAVEITKAWSLVIPVTVVREVLQ